MRRRIVKLLNCERAGRPYEFNVPQFFEIESEILINKFPYRNISQFSRLLNQQIRLLIEQPSSNSSMTGEYLVA